MTSIVYLSNCCDGPFKGQGHGQQPKSGDPAHGWHWLQNTDQSLESIPLVAGKAQHFETPQQAINHARDYGFEVHADPKFKATLAVIP
jgi:hypothetical protein